MKMPVIDVNDFQKVLDMHPRLGDKTKKAANLVLVKGYTQTAAAEMVGIKSVQLLNRRIKDLILSYETVRPCPKGWTEIKLQIPPVLEGEVDRLKGLIVKERLKHEANNV